MFTTALVLITSAMAVCSIGAVVIINNENSDSSTESFDTFYYEELVF